jgi:protein TonB
VRILPPPEPEIQPAAPPPSAPAAPPPQKPRREPKAAPRPKAPATPREAPAPVVKAPERPAAVEPPAARAEPAPVAPVPQEAPPAPPAPPAKTGVSIPASYAATNRKPEYPAMSRRYEEQGTVVLRVLVKADGTVGAVEIKSSSGYPLLDESAKSTVRTWRFNPATSDGQPIAEWYQVPIPFKLQN